MFALKQAIKKLNFHFLGGGGRLLFQGRPPTLPLSQICTHGWVSFQGTQRAWGLGLLCCGGWTAICA